MVHEVQLQSLCNEMCRYWKVQRHFDVRIDDGTELKENQGILKYSKSLVLVKRGINDDSTLYNFYHEMRHIWQFRWYRRVVRWWQFRPNLYQRNYLSCNIEVDAAEFAHQVVDLRVPWRIARGRDDLLVNFQKLINANGHRF